MSKKIRIVLIEDDADDVELLQDALNNNNVSYSITVLKDGSAAAAFCESSDILPDIIIMDFNLPRIHGREVINLIRCKAKFANVPILVLSTSTAKEDMAYATKVGADKYLVKPATLEAIQQTVDTILKMVNHKIISAF